MRTTLEIEDDVYAHARELAGYARASIGQTVSRLLRLGIQAESRSNIPAVDPEPDSPFIMRNGVAVIRGVPGRVVTTEMVNRIRDEEGI